MWKARRRGGGWGERPSGKGGKVGMIIEWRKGKERKGKERKGRKVFLSSVDTYCDSLLLMSIESSDIGGGLTSPFPLPSNRSDRLIIEDAVR